MRTSFLSLLAVILAGTALAGRAQSDSQPGAPEFDTPVSHRVLDLGRSPYGRARLTCDSFAGFMVKEFDLGEEGAEWFAMAPADGSHPPACSRMHSAAEKVISRREWCGYLAGVKQDYVFLSACDAHNAGRDFAVYDAHTGKQVFEDTAIDSSAGGVRFANASGGGLALTYTRLALFDCTLPADKEACWNRISGQLRLGDAAMPTCIAYEKQMTGTVVAYPVEVTLTPKPTLRPVAGKLRCWPPE